MRYCKSILIFTWGEGETAFLGYFKCTNSIVPGSLIRKHLYNRDSGNVFKTWQYKHTRYLVPKNRKLLTVSCLSIEIFGVPWEPFLRHILT